MGFCDENDDGTISCSEFTKAGFKSFLVTINVLFVFIAFGVMGMSAWALTTFAEFKNLISAESLLLLAFTGLFIFIVAMLGCGGTLWMHKWMLFAYTGLVFVLTILLAISAISILVFAGKVDAPNTITDEVVSELHSFVNCSYNKCCIPEADGSFNFGDRAAVSLSDAQRLVGKSTTCQTRVGVAGAVCGVLHEMNINNIENCNEYPLYKASLNEWIENNFATIGYVALAVGCVQFWGMAVACGLICTTDHSPKVDPDDDFDEY